MRFVLRRIAFALALVFLVSSASFVLVHLAPGDYFTEFGPGAEKRARAERAAEGFDRPLAAQYATWMSRAVRLDLGMSLKFRQPVRDLVWPRTLNTALLGVCAFVVATLLGIPLGVFTGAGDAGLLRAAVRAASSALLALPPLVIAMALTAGAARSGWLPPPGLQLSNMLVPAIALAIPVAAIIERTHSQAIRTILGEPYIRAAVARGVPPVQVVWRHAMRGALGSTVGAYGVLAGALLSGSFVVELIADWPGLALLTADAVRARDPFLVCGCTSAAAIVLAGAVLFFDMLHLWIDPRVGRT